MEFALFEIKLALATIMTQHDLRLVEQAPVELIGGERRSPQGIIHFIAQ
jgi:hypothetical protein